MTTTTKPFTLTIHRDTYPDSPRNWDNLGTVFIGPRCRYRFGDTFAKDIRDEDGMIDDGIYISLPIYMYDHSGIAISTTPFSYRWDSSCVGFIYVRKDVVRAKYGWDRLTKARLAVIYEYLNNEIKTLDQYITGEVYGYTVTCNATEDEIDSCWGFYGNDWVKNGLFDYAKYDRETFDLKLEWED